MVIKRDFEKKVLWVMALLMILGAVINSIYTLVTIKFTPERLKLLINITVVEMPILIGLALLLIHSWFRPVTEFFDELEEKGEGKVDKQIAKSARRIANQLPLRLVFVEFSATLTVGLSAGAWMRIVYGHLSAGESVAIFASTFINSINVVVLLFYLTIRFRQELMRLTSYAQDEIGERKTEGIGIALKTQVAVVSVMLLALFFGSIMFIKYASGTLDARLQEQAKQLVNDTSEKIALLGELNRVTTDSLNTLLFNTKMGEKGNSFILNQTGGLVAGNLPPELLQKVKEIKGDVWEDVRLNCTFVTTPLKGYNWQLSTVYFTKDFDAPIMKMWTLLLMFTLIIIVIGNIYAYLVSHDISTPIQNLINTSRKIAAGDLSLTAPVVTGDEVGVLGNIFNRMIENLKNTMDEIHKNAALRQEEQEKLHNGVARILKAVEAVEKGDLTKEITEMGEGEIARLSQAVNAMLRDIRKIIQQIRDAAIHLGSAGNELLATAQQLSSGSTEQASSIAQITSTVEELASTSRQIAENSDSVVKVAEEALNSVQLGQDSVDDVAHSMTEIRDKVEAGCKRVLSLGEKSQRIGDVLDIINHIADETKLIAFNAAIEASRAGEAGKGFSVVAVEVRKLAENVVESTKTIKEIVGEIQALTSASVMATEEETKRVEHGVELAQKAGGAISDILDMVDHTTKSAKQISIATQQQKTASEQIVGTMREIAEVSKQSASGSRQTADSASDLSRLADDLKRLVERFKLEAEK